MVCQSDGPVHVAKLVRRYNGKTCESYLLRRTFREDGNVKLEERVRAYVFLCMLDYYVAKNRVRASGAAKADFDVITELTPLQRRVFDLLGVVVNL